MKALRIAAAILASIIISVGSHAADFTKPNFAFPEKVNKQAEIQLKKARNEGDAPAAVRALMNMTLADQAVSDERQDKAIARLNKYINSAKTYDERAMLSLFLAKFYASIYQEKHWVYDRRNLPLTPVPESVDEWSGDQFRMKIRELTDAALINPSALLKSPLRNWNGVVTIGFLTETYYPTLFEFASQTAIDLLTEVSNSSSHLPYRCLTLGGAEATSPQINSYWGHVLNLYDGWVNLTEKRSTPAFIHADIDRISFITSHVVDAKPIKLYFQLADKYADSEWSGDAVIAAASYCVGPTWEGEIVKRAKMLLEKYPSYPRADRLHNIVNSLTLAMMNIETPNCVPPGSPVKIEVEMANINKAAVGVYKVDIKPTANSFSFTPTSKYEKIAEIPVEAAGEKPFKTTVTTEFSFPEVGNYVIVPIINGKRPEKENYYSTVAVTRLALIAASTPLEFWVVNPADGSPVTGADIFRADRRDKIVKVGTFNGKGLIAPKVSDGYHQYYATLGKDRSLFIDFREPSDNWKNAISVNINTSLPLYRPGDEVEFSTLAIESDIHGKRFLADTQLKASLLDVNHRTVDTLTATTDKWGRVFGRFKLPENSLQGRFTIAVNINDRTEYKSINVSDYKLPTFSVELQNPLQQADGSFKIQGIARLYSGYAVENAEVKVAVSTSSWNNRFYGNSEQAFCTLNTVTDSKGAFEVNLTREDLEKALVDSKFYVAVATVTLPTGESREGSVCFYDGNFVKVMVTLPRSIDITNPVRLPVKTYNSQNTEINVPVKYSVSRNDSTLMESTVVPEADWSKLSSGKVTVTFCAEGDTTRCETILYKPTDKESPSEQLLWTPSDEITTDKAGKAAILLGSTAKTRGLYILSSDTATIVTKWVNIEKGLGKLVIELPEGIDSGRLRLTAIGDYRSGAINVNLKRPDKEREIKLEIESFRDNITPGEKENWTIRITNSQNLGVESAVILDMWNKSIASISSPDLRISADDPADFAILRRTSSTTFTNIGNYWRENYTYNRYKDPVFPHFNLWRRDFVSRKFATDLYIKRESLGATQSEGQNDDLYITNVVVEAKAAAPAMAAEEEAMTEGTSDNGSKQSVISNESFSYRDAETPLAFFRPMLTTNAEGVLEYSFTVPNANTTWVLNALAVSENVTVGSKELTAIASKPLMVKPSLPRFLRAGDRISLPSLVINNSDDGGIVNTEIELFNAVTDATIESKTFTNRLPAGASATVSVDLTTPSDISLLGYRVKSTMGAFADGEQGAVAVLPSTTRVIESQPFYMSPDSTQMTLKVPRSGEDARVTLTFCENPTWLVVSALPGLLEGTPNTSPEAARHIYSAAVASGLLRSNPALGRAIQEWTENPKDSTLTSMLSRNADLKNMLLQATPWVGDAASDTERMSRLALLLNRDNINKEITGGIKTLAALVDKGGLKWSGGSAEASQWATMRVLDLLGRLNVAGWLPADRELRRQINEAVVWLDARIAEQYRKYPGGNYVDYVIVRDRFPAIRQSTAAARATDATIQQLIGRWHDLSILSKAEAALVLENHSYHATAMEILKSLREYASTSPEEGMWWPKLTDKYASGMDANSATAVVLEAFATVDPTSADVDLIRQWLILQKEAQDWGKSTDATRLVAAILSTSPKWLTPARGAVVTVNNSEITPAAVEKSLGSFSEDITKEAREGATIKIHRPGNAPSWGAVVRSFSDSILSVKAARIKGLSIEKRMYPLDDKGNATNFAGELQIGSKVKVELLVKCDRPLDYVSITDQRPACFEPVDQLPGYIWSEGIRFYRVNADTETSIFIDTLPKGTYLLSYEMWVTTAGMFIDGIATIQSQYQPTLTAHSGALELVVKNQ